MFKTRFVVLAACLWVGWGKPVLGEPDRPAIRVAVVSERPSIDGRLDDPAWGQAEVLDDFTQVLPEEGAEPSERTEVRILQTRDMLYVGIHCLDREPEGILVKELGQDSRLSSDDYVEVVLDPFFQQREGYFFMANAAGARSEGLIENFDEHNQLWDTVWWCKARIDDHGWTVEMGIPFKSLSFDRGLTTWGFNVERVIRRRQESVRWTGISAARRVTSLADAGELVGIDNPHQGWGLEVKPSLSAKYSKDHLAPDSDWESKPSLDFTYNITPSLKANVTLNTDFAEAEVDDRRVNLTRFPLFFPEKRDFFLQDAAMFRFGGLDSYPITPYYSRRIGLDPDGNPVDILFGGRLTGHVGGTRVAVQHVHQDSYDGVEETGLFVGRVSTRVLGESDLGAMVTYGDPLSNRDAVLAGLDFNYLDSQFLDGKTLTGHVWGLGASPDQGEDADYAFSLDIDYPNEPLDVHLIFRQVGEDFDPALGFVKRQGVRDYIASLRYLWRPNTDWVRSVSLGLRPIWTTGLDGEIVAEDHDLPMVTVNTPQLDRLYAFYTYDRDILDEDFEIQPDIVIPPDDYINDQVEAGFYTSQARPVGFSGSLRGGNFYDGDRTDFEAGMVLRPIRFLSAGASYDLKQVRLPQGDFDVHIVEGRLELAASPDLSWNTTIQHDNVSDEVGLNSRIHWTYRPGTDFYVVVNRSFEFDHWAFHPQQTETTLKGGATLRF